MNYLLYGNDIDQTINPLEAALNWLTKLDKSDFIERKAIVTEKNKIVQTLLLLLFFSVQITF